MPATVVSLSQDTISACLSVCVDALRKGGVIVFPTESSYALGADATNEAAVDKIYELKERPAAKGLPVLVDSVETIAKYAKTEGLAHFLADRLMPGQLNLIVPQKPGMLAPNVGENDSIAFRIPNHDFDQRLARAFGKPITATSANLSGHPAIYSFIEARARFGHNAAVIVDAGDLPLRVFSTVFDLTRQPHVITRQGMLGAKKLYATVRQFYEAQNPPKNEWVGQDDELHAPQKPAPKTKLPAKTTKTITKPKLVPAKNKK